MRYACQLDGLRRLDLAANDRAGLRQRQRHDAHCGAGDEDVVGVLVELAGRTEPLEQAVHRHRDAVAHRHGLDLVVGEEDRRDAEAALQRGDLRAVLRAKLRVEVVQRIVHQENLRIAHDRAAIATRWR